MIRSSFRIRLWQIVRHVFGQREIGWIGLFLSVGAIVILTTMPWSDVQDHGHWERVEWMPFTSRYVSTRDVVLNVALFVPLGVTLTRVLPRSGPGAPGAVVRVGPRTALCGGLGAALALTVELVQVYSHGHFPSATDVVSNTLGAALGAALMLQGRARVAEVLAAGEAPSDATKSGLDASRAGLEE